MPASIEQKPLLGKVTIKTQLVVETGLHIGGGGENLDIGGLDKPVIRDPLTQYPYLPGSSIKGKLRSILERLLNKPLNRPGGSGTYRYESDDLEDGFTEIGKLLIRYEGANTCPISRLFGSTGSNCWLEKDKPELQELAHLQNISSRHIAWVDKAKTGRFVENAQTQLNPDELVKEFIKVKGRNCPARMIIRDCHLLPESAAQLKKIDTGLFMTEWKFENGIDRVTAAANPRQLERVPAGSKFQFELIYTVENREQAVEDLQNIAISLAILEDDALGGHGSRGYGKVKFQGFNFAYRSLDQYRLITSTPDGISDLTTIEPIADTQALLDNFVNLSSDILRRLPPAEGNRN
jgi:CRISPR-associated protein Csm3